MGNLRREFMEDDDKKRIWNQERTILEVTELICETMEQKGISRSELAARLGKTKGHVTQLLAGNRNMTIRTLSDVFTVMGCEVQFWTSDIEKPVSTFSFDTPFSATQMEASGDTIDWNISQTG